MQDQGLDETRRAASAQRLATLRAQIDSTDDQLHRALMRRLEIVEEIGVAKRESGDALAFRPAREAQVMRRLHAKTPDPVAFRQIAQIWREIVSGATAQQGGLTVSIHAPEGSENARTLSRIARDHFGAAAQFLTREAFGRVADDIRSPTHRAIGIAPAVRGESSPAAWWTACQSFDGDAPHIVAALPFVGGPIEAYCVSVTPLEPSGDDATLLAVHRPEPISRSAVSVALDKAGLPATHLATSDSSYLLEVEGFIDMDGSEIGRVADAFGVEVENVSIIGGYARPIALEGDIA